MNNPPKVILITGTSSGFGFLTAIHLASLGHKVYATMRDVSRKDVLLKEVAKSGGNVHVLELDVTKIPTIAHAVNHIAAKEGRIDVLINNAGYGLGGFFEDLTAEEIQHQMDVNFFGVQNVTRLVIPLMRSHRKGRIINISSIAGLSASPCFSAYNASKWALEGFSESLYHELKLFNIDVCLIEPGTYPTKIFYDNAQYAKNFDNTASPYYTLSQYLKHKVLNFVGKTKKDPKRIALIVERLINSPNPSFRNLPDMETKFLVLIRRIVPFRWYASLIRTTLFQGKNI